MLLWTIWNWRSIKVHSVYRYAVKIIMQLWCHTHLVVVSSLLDEFVDYFLGLLVTLLLQVSDERVQMARTIICLYNHQMSLDDKSNTCKHTRTCQLSRLQANKGKCLQAEYQAFYLTFQQQRQSVCKHQRSSLLTQVSSCSKDQVLLSFGGKLCENMWDGTLKMRPRYLWLFLIKNKDENWDWVCWFEGRIIQRRFPWNLDGGWDSTQNRPRTDRFSHFPKHCETECFQTLSLISQRNALHLKITTKNPPVYRRLVSTSDNKRGLLGLGRGIHFTECHCSLKNESKMYHHTLLLKKCFTFYVRFYFNAECNRSEALHLV